MARFDEPPKGEPEYNGESLDDVLEEMMWGMDFRYDGAPYTSTELYRFIQRIRRAVAETTVPKPV